MRKSVYCVTKNIHYDKASPITTTRTFAKEEQAKFYFDTTIAAMKQQYAYAVEASKNQNSAWKEISSDLEWQLNNATIGVSYDVRMYDVEVDPDAPSLTRMEEIIVALIDYMYAASDNDRAAINAMLSKDIGLDEYEMAYFALPDKPDAVSFDVEALEPEPAALPAPTTPSPEIVESIEATEVTA